MATVERTAHIPSPANEVWEVLANYGAISQWAQNVEHSCLLTESGEGLGAKRRIQVGRATVVETVTKWEPNVSLAYAITGLPAVVRSCSNTWHLVETANGTDVSIVSEVDAGPRPPQQAIAKVVCRKLATTSDEMLAGLTSFLATRSSASANTSSGKN